MAFPKEPENLELTSISDYDYIEVESSEVKSSEVKSSEVKSSEVKSSEGDLPYLCDEICPFSIQTIVSDEIKSSTIIHNGHELVSKLRQIETLNPNIIVRFTLDSSDWYKNSEWVQAKIKDESVYSILKTFWTFQYHPLPVVSTDCRITLGSTNRNQEHTYWHTNLSLSDTQKLVDQLLPFNSSFRENTKTSSKLKLSLGLKFRDSRFVSINKYSNPEEIKASLDLYQEKFGFSE